MVSLDSIKKPELLFNVTVHRTLTTEKLCRLFRKFKPYLEFLVKCKINKKCDFIASMYHLHIDFLSSTVFFHQRFILIFRNIGHLVLTFYLILNFFVVTGTYVALYRVQQSCSCGKRQWWLALRMGTWTPTPWGQYLSPWWQIHTKHE